MGIMFDESSEAMYRKVPVQSPLSQTSGTDTADRKEQEVQNVNEVPIMYDESSDAVYRKVEMNSPLSTGSVDTLGSPTMGNPNTSDSPASTGTLNGIYTASPEE